MPIRRIVVVDIVFILPSAMPDMLVIVMAVMVVSLGIHDINFRVAMRMFDATSSQADRGEGYSPG